MSPLFQRSATESDFASLRGGIDPVQASVLIEDILNEKWFDARGTFLDSRDHAFVQGMGHIVIA